MRGDDEVGSVIDHARHSRFSDPGRYRGLFDELPTDPSGLSVVARNVIVHYRASGHVLPDETRHEINARWLEQTLAADQGRHPPSLSEPREVHDRVQGCCRDHTLFCLGVLRTHGIPARSRVGFAGYFVDSWHHDHVIVEAWLDGRWQRFDPEIDARRPSLPTPMDIGWCTLDSTGFVTAAQVWAGYRRGAIDPEMYGVGPEVPGFRGPCFVFDEVIHEVAHRFGDELLLWDGWGRMTDPDGAVSEADASWLDAIAETLLGADQGDSDAERALLEQYRRDDGLQPGSSVVQASPYGDPPIEVRLDGPVRP